MLLSTFDVPLVIVFVDFLAIRYNRKSRVTLYNFCCRPGLAIQRTQLPFRENSYFKTIIYALELHTASGLVIVSRPFQQNALQVVFWFGFFVFFLKMKYIKSSY